MPKLSIITINFNDKAGLEKTIKSFVSQSFIDIEFIVIDGGSTDGSLELIKKYEKQLSYWCSEKDSGIYNAQNKGLKVAKGEYCLFLNSGDYLVHERIIENVFARNYAEDIIYGDMMVDWGAGKITLEKMHKNITLYEMYIDTVWHPVSFIRRALFEKYGNYDEHFKIVADYEFFFRAIIINSASTRYLPVAISVFGFNGLSSDPSNKATEKAERVTVWKKYLSDSQIDSLEDKLQEEIKKKRKLFNRIINKLRC